jgi:hypothetical protein
MSREVHRQDLRRHLHTSKARFFLWKRAGVMIIGGSDNETLGKWRGFKIRETTNRKVNRLCPLVHIASGYILILALYRCKSIRLKTDSYKLNLSCRNICKSGTTGWIQNSFSPSCSIAFTHLGCGPG